MTSNSVHHICLFRLSALGDISHVIPLVRAICRDRQNVQIDWIIAPQFCELIPELPQLRLIPFDKRGGWRAVRQLRRDIRPRYHSLLHLQTSLRANLLSLLIKADQRIGWDAARAREGHRWCINHSISETPPQHQVQGFLAFARACGSSVNQPEWNLQISAVAAQFARQHLPADKRILMISPCSSHPLRNWSAAGYAAVADYAAAKPGWTVCLIGGRSVYEQSLADRIVRQSKATIINLTGTDTLPQMLALLKRADIVLSPDAGPVHWANALGTPVLGLYAATRPARSGPYNSLEYCVDRYAEAAEAFEHRSADTLRWGKRIEHDGVMNLITVEAVIEQLERAVTAVNPA